MRSVLAGGVVFLVSAAALGQTVAPVSLATVVSRPPSVSRVSVDRKHHADLLRWQVTDPLAPYNGTTLVWLELNPADVRLSVDAQAHFDDITHSAVDRSVVALVSGGMWRGAYDAQWRQRKADGLVVASGALKGGLNATDAGGVAVICGADVSILPMSAFPKQTVEKSVVLPCTKAAPSALQSNVLLVRDGEADSFRDDSAANRMALCAGKGKVVIAGAFNSVGHALTLQQFADFVAAAARKRKIASLSALNLDGACAAQLFIPQIKAHYGCNGDNYAVNRIVIRSAR